MLTALGVMMTAMTLLVGALAVIGWTSIESKLRDHSYDYMRSDLKSGGPLQELVRRAVRDAVYEGVRPIDPDEEYEDIDNPESGK
jgi:formaldehyde-activating enzyme involved in methanogenesis